MRAFVTAEDVDPLLDQIDRCDPQGTRFTYVAGLPDDGVELDIPSDVDALTLKFLYPSTRLSN